MFKQKNITKSFKSPFNKPLKKSEIKGECNATKEKSHLGQEGENPKNESGKKKPLISKKTVRNNAENSHNKKEKKTETKKLPMTSLTDVQYEEIFSSAINRVVTEDPSPVNSSDEEEIEDRAAIPKADEAYSAPESAERPEEFISNTALPTNKQKSNMCCKTDKLNESEINKPDKAFDFKQTKKTVKSFVPISKNKESIKNLRDGDEYKQKDHDKKEITSSSHSCDTQHSHSSGHVCKKAHSHTHGHQISSQSSNHSQQLSLSQRSQQAISQPDQNLSLKERLLWLQDRRQVGLWVQCSRPICNKWRYLKNVCDPIEIPHEWFCHMNSDEKYNSCAIPEKPPTPLQEEDLIHNLYNAGSMVWGRLDGYPWWPAMVDDCPDTEQYYWLNSFSDIPTHYNVVFFDEKDVTRAWLTPGKLRAFTGNETSKEFRKTTAHGVDYAKRLQVAKTQALKALAMSISERLRTFSFLARFKGPFGTLNKKKTDHANKRRHDTDESEEENEITDYGKSALERNMTNEQHGNKKKKLISNVFAKKSETNSRAKKRSFIKDNAVEDGVSNYRNSNVKSTSINNIEQGTSSKEKAKNKFGFNDSSLYTQELTNKESDKPKQKPIFGMKNQFVMNKKVKLQNTDLTAKKQDAPQKNPPPEMKWREQQKQKYVDMSSSDDEVCSIASLQDEDICCSQDLFISDVEDAHQQTMATIKDDIGAIIGCNKHLKPHAKATTEYNKASTSCDSHKIHTEEIDSEQTKATTDDSTRVNIGRNKFPNLFDSRKKNAEENDSEQTKETTDDSTRVIIGCNKFPNLFDSRKKKAEENDSEQTKETTNDSTRVNIGCNKFPNLFDSRKKKAEENDSEQTKETTDDSTRVIIGRNIFPNMFDSQKKKAEENDSEQTKETTDDSTRVIIGRNKFPNMFDSQKKKAEENDSEQTKETTNGSTRTISDFNKTIVHKNQNNNAEEEELPASSLINILKDREDIQNESCLVYDQEINCNKPGSSTEFEIINKTLDVNINENHILDVPSVDSNNEHGDSTDVANVNTSDNVNGDAENGQILPTLSNENAHDANIQVRESSPCSSMAVVPSSLRNTPQQNSDGVVPQINPYDSLYDSDDFEPEE